VIVDASAILAIVFDEPSPARCLQTLLDSPTNRMSAASFLETAIAVDRLFTAGDSATFDALLVRRGISVEPVTAHQATTVREAYQHYGRGSGHPARLNFGACFAYALARDLDEPLLVIGPDLVHTDVRPALP
jgi:ribonuclease VapC